MKLKNGRTSVRAVRPLWPIGGRGEGKAWLQRATTDVAKSAILLSGNLGERNECVERYEELAMQIQGFEPATV